MRGGVLVAAIFPPAQFPCQKSSSNSTHRKKSTTHYFTKLPTRSSDHAMPTMQFGAKKLRNLAGRRRHASERLRSSYHNPNSPQCAKTVAKNFPVFAVAKMWLAACVAKNSTQADSHENSSSSFASIRLEFVSFR